MFIKRLEQNVYDVFVGTQWDEWTRVRRYPWGVRILAGLKLSQDSMKELRKKLHIK